jgi:hypothetical protein
MSKNKKESLEFEHFSIFYVTIRAKKNDTILQAVVQAFNMNCFAKFRRTLKKCAEKLSHLIQLLFREL